MLETIVPPNNEKRYTMTQLKDLLVLYTLTREKFYIDTGATYQPILSPSQNISAFFSWITFNETQDLVRSK